MKKKLFSIIFLLLFFLFIPKQAYSFYDPLSQSTNNVYGIHILNESDIESAANLVNSNGKWGYVTLVIREDERDIKRWQEFMNILRKKKLIPIVRIATKASNGNWMKLDKNEVDNWVYFLNSLNWVIDNRYVIIGNEPNHAKEWGGVVNPEEYKEVLCEYSSKLKASSSDYYILPAGLDASAPTSKDTMDESVFLERMIKHQNNLESCIDGWTSHSYPNPNFSASEFNQGKISLKTYVWELNFLKTKGINKSLPVFITETGWKHSVGNFNSKYLSPQTLSERYKNAFNIFLNDLNIVAVTPFVLSYKEAPFLEFSWIDENNNPYSFYDTVKNLEKPKGTPHITDRGKINVAIIPKIFTFDESASIVVLIKNEGKAIWENDLDILVEEDGEDGQIFKVEEIIEPGQTNIKSIKILINTNKENIRGRLKLIRGGETISNEYPFEILVLKPINNTSNISYDLKSIFQWLIIDKIKKVNLMSIFGKI